MRSISLFMQSTLNGYGTDPGNEMFWAAISDQTWETTRMIRETCDTVILGRKQYEEFVGFWPGAAENDDDSDVTVHARWFRDVAKVVFSTTLTEPDPAWPHTTIHSSIDEIKALKEGSGKNLVIFGGLGIIDSFATENLIDDYFIHINPTVIGEGTLLLNTRLDLQLVSSETLDSGVLATHYRRA